jgi:hypothetical protein
MSSIYAQYEPEELYNVLVQAMCEATIHQEIAEVCADVVLETFGLFNDDLSYREGTYIEVVRL